MVCVLGLGIDDKQLMEEGYNCYGVVFHVPNGEDMNHLLLHCSAALDLSPLIFSLFGVYWVMPSMVQEVLVAWKEGWFGGGSIGTIWWVVLLCLMW